MRPHLSALALTLLLAACDQGPAQPPADLVLPDGARYHGALRDGRLHGEGRLDYGNGAWYQGRFANGQFDGPGEWHGADGSHYQGAFRAGLYHGQGQLDDGQGNEYIGDFANGQLRGAGTFSDADGDRYEGAFENTEFSGQGRFVNADGDVWSGQFSQGALNGRGEYQGRDGSHYQGEFKDWRFAGEGELTQADGQVYKGRFEDGKFNGKGSLRGGDGREQAGTWSNGLRRLDEHGKRLPNPLEVGLLEQGRLLDHALAALPPSTPQVELYGLSVGGDGKQSVFLREADYVAHLLDQRFGARGVVTLANNRNHADDRPMATRESLARAIRALARQSGPEDLIFIYLTSHGSHDHQLILDMPGMRLDNLPADDLASLLAPLKERDKVLVISACYSGGFIEPLKDGRTLIMTAARSDRVSFGCSEEADFTYFGQALFADALNATDDLQEAFRQASAEVAKRETEDGFEASEPQLWAPPAVLQHWNALRAGQASRALSADAGTGQEKR
ncbi:C13 family peptidase [Pseudomonas citronellolis]|uniref:C13 family peptidase n=1 Tax=Pseudomonas citronellolis TaxID=53408 RepID=UPI0023E39AAB|nr:C13 family peptidase [Pseudomonas citronellolis]MDF3935259.1 C13 family peptidase [Pseudomonas citronellolis]